MIFALLLTLSACGSGQTMQSDSPKKSDKGTSTNQKTTQKKKLSQDEKAALAFLKGYDSQDKSKRQQAVNKFISGPAKKLFELGASSSPTHQWTNFKVIESIKKKDKQGKQATLVLLHANDENGNLYERIAAVENGKVIYVYSPKSSDKSIKQTYKKLRADFKTPIPAQIKQQQKAESSKKAKIKVVKQTATAWKDSGGISINSSAIIKNTGNTNASIGNIQINMVGKDGSVIGTGTATADPGTLKPGQTAFVTDTELESHSKVSDFKKSTYNIDFNNTTQDPQELKTTKIKMTAADQYSLSPYKITGVVHNNTKAKVDNVTVSAALFDKNGNLLGIMNTTLMVSINPGGTAGFDIQDPPMPPSIAGKADSVKVKAYNWQM